MTGTSRRLFFSFRSFVLLACLAGCGASPDTARAASSGDGGSGDASACDYPPVQDDPRCPPKYPGIAALGTACSPVGLECQYPGAGDGDPARCSAATAVMWCRAGGDGDAGDAGASVGDWVVAQ